MSYLRITDAGKMASGNVAKATKELDGFCQKGQSLDRRPPSASTMNRLINMRTLSVELHCQIHRSDAPYREEMQLWPRI